MKIYTTTYVSCDFQNYTYLLLCVEYTVWIQLSIIMIKSMLRLFDV